MDYKEKYEEIIKKLKEAKENMGGYTFSSVLDKIIPELKESEDERIRKEILNVFKQLDECTTICGRNYDYAKWIAWLEKQGEQKPTDKVEQKFKVGDWIVNNNGEPRVFRVEKKDWPDCIISSSLGNQFINTFTLDKQYHLWTIQDAKNGDVLSFNDGHGNDCIELIKSITDKKIEFWFCLTNGNQYEVFDGVVPYTNLASREDAAPATKEQRDTLERAMTNAGYRWNKEELKLEKI